MFTNVEERGNIILKCALKSVSEKAFMLNLSGESFCVNSFTREMLCKFSHKRDIYKCDHPVKRLQMWKKEEFSYLKALLRA